ncbi:hypothetical protein L3Q82_005161 [Scortum barcoo]|uniref:Uncharacterized protein n=1 Tax=Scortum barcoo TaxID=214431 RepID=A0ACB8V935_9TELE|nr:hypothetical protein L3Q82_005161 [Scortum barcoo]
MRNCAVLCLTETWLNDNMPDPAFQIDGRLLFRADRNQQSGKARGGGLCVYVNKDWCTNCTCTNTRRRFTWLRGDFNHVNLTDTLPKFYQHVTIPTRGNNTLDRVYTNKRDAYRAVPHPHLGFSDHISIMLLPAYRPLVMAHIKDCA